MMRLSEPKIQKARLYWVSHNSLSFSQMKLMLLWEKKMPVLNVYVYTKCTMAVLERSFAVSVFWLEIIFSSLQLCSYLLGFAERFSLEIWFETNSFEWQHQINLPNQIRKSVWCILLDAAKGIQHLGRASESMYKSFLFRFILIWFSDQNQSIELTLYFLNNWKDWTANKNGADHLNCPGTDPHVLTA